MKNSIFLNNNSKELFKQTPLPYINDPIQWSSLLYSLFNCPRPLYGIRDGDLSKIRLSMFDASNKLYQKECVRLQKLEFRLRHVYGKGKLPWHDPNIINLCTPEEVKYFKELQVASIVHCLDNLGIQKCMRKLLNYELCYGPNLNLYCCVGLDTFSFNRYIQYDPANLTYALWIDIYGKEIRRPTLKEYRTYHSIISSRRLYMIALDERIRNTAKIGTIGKLALTKDAWDAHTWFITCNELLQDNTDRSEVELRDLIKDLDRNPKSVLKVIYSKHKPLVLGFTCQFTPNGITQIPCNHLFPMPTDPLLIVTDVDHAPQYIVITRSQYGEYLKEAEKSNASFFMIYRMWDPKNNTFGGYLGKAAGKLQHAPAPMSLELMKYR